MYNVINIIVTMDTNFGNDKVGGMKSVIDLIVLMVLATAGFVAWGETPAGKNTSLTRVAEEDVRVSPNIVVMSPLPNDQVEGYVNVSGKAKVHNNQLKITLKDGVSGNILKEDMILVLSPGIDLFGPFNYEVNFDNYTEGRRYLIELSPQIVLSGEKEEKIIIPVVFWKSSTREVTP